MVNIPLNWWLSDFATTHRNGYFFVGQGGTWWSTSEKIWGEIAYFQSHNRRAGFFGCSLVDLTWPSETSWRWANPMTKAHQPRSISPVYPSMCPHYFHAHSHFWSVTFQFLLPQLQLWKIDHSWFVSGHRWISGRLGPIRSHLQIIPDPRFSMEVSIVMEIPQDFLWLVYFRSESKMDENWGSPYDSGNLHISIYPNYIP